MRENKPFSILSIDGGGIRGLFSASILEKIENELHTPLRDLFDLIVGTSTGSIIAGAVALNYQMSDVKRLYLEKGYQIFRKKCFYIPLISSKYNNENLKRELHSLFGKTILGNIDKPLMIVSTDMSVGDVYIHKSNYLAMTEKYIRDGNTKLTDAILSSCAAPTYFNPVYMKRGNLLCDGGLWANNPSVIGVTEAIKRFGCDVDDIHILSIGTGESNVSYGKRKRHLWGLATGWKRAKLIKYLLNVSSKRETNISRLILNERYVRVNGGVEHALDDTKHLDVLVCRAHECYDKNRESIIHFIKTVEGEL